MGRRTSLGALAALVLTCTGWSQSACSECHRPIADKYAKTGMARSFQSVSADTVLPGFDGRTFSHAASGQYFTPLRRDGKYFVRRYQRGPDGTDVNVHEAPVDFVMGSGDHSRSYFHRTPDNRLVEFPVSWYSVDGGHWGMSPGFDRAGHQGFSREVTYRCMFCHNAYPEANARDAQWDGATRFAGALPQGIDCRRCHGLGAKHIQAARRGASSATLRAAIVNPARLEPARRMEVCMQCHLEATSSPLPSVVKRQGRDVFSYRPGEPLANYALYFDHAPGSGHQDKFEIVSAAYRFRKSRCFEASPDQFGCTSCHDPHQADSREEAVAKTNGVCQGCHATPALTRPRHTAAQDCVGCHMPQRRAADVPHVLITDHRIGLYPQSGVEPAKPIDANVPPYAGEVVLYYPRELPPAAELDLALAQVKNLSNLPAGLRKLDDAVRRHRPATARPYFELGQAYVATGQAARAIPFFEEAVKREPRQWRYLHSLAQALSTSGQTARAVKMFELARTAAPGEIAIHLALANAYADQNNLSQALTSLRQALDLHPESAAGLAQFGNTLVRTGDVAGAERVLRQAVRLRPEVAAIRINLAHALIGTGKLSEARHELEEAIRAGPATESAYSAWYSALASGGTPAEARARFDASRAAQLAPSHSNLGAVLAMLGDEDGAIREYRLAVAADPNSAVARTNLGMALAARGSAVEARQQLEEALRIMPNLGQAQLSLGELLLSQGETARGIEHLQRAATSADPRVAKAATAMLGRRR